MLRRSQEGINRNDTPIDPGQLHGVREGDSRLTFPNAHVDDNPTAVLRRQPLQGAVVSIPALDLFGGMPQREALPNIFPI